MDFTQLPALGLGASLSLSAQPDPVELVRAAGGPRFVEYAGLVDVESVQAQVDAIRAAGAAILYHPSCINFCGSYGNAARWLDATARHIAAVGSPWFAQDCAYCFRGSDHHYSTSLGYFVPPILSHASLATATDRVREVQDRVQVPVAIEPPPMTFRVGTLPLLAFFGELAEATDCALLFDMGHLVSYELASGERIRDQLHFLPAERVIEVHVAGGRIRTSADGPVYVDAHEADILDATWQMFRDLLPVLPNVRAVCYECEGIAGAEVLKTLAEIRTVLLADTASAALRESLAA